MNPDPAVKSTTQATIPVPLQQALSSLDVSLENELARYRRLRPRQPRPRPQVDPQRLQPLELFEPGRTPPVSSTETPPVGEKPHPPAPRLEIADADGTTAVSSIVHQPAPTQTQVEKQEPPVPQEYLQSSENLLRSLQADQTESTQDKKPTNSLLTPLGIGSILVLLVSSALLGSALINEEGLRRFRLDQLLVGTSSSDNTDEPETTEVAPVNPVDLGIPQSPNLASQEFVDLDLGSLSTLPLDKVESEPNIPTSVPTPPQDSQAQSAPASPPAPTASGTSSNLTTALLPPALRPQPVAPTDAAPSSATTPDAVEAAPAPTNENFYFVMVDYTGANSLTKARELVRDAYLVELPEGVHIQMGASPQESAAQELAKELQDQGFVASVYRP